MTTIYLIKNISDQELEVYIGKTSHLKNRERSHRKRFGKQIILEILEIIESKISKDWKPLEIKWIEYYKNLGFKLININKGGNGPDIQSDETKLKISKSKIGNKFNLGNKYSYFSKQRIINSKKGKKYNILKKGKEHGNFGKIRDEQWKIKQKESKKGLKYSEESCLKISKGKVGKGLKPIEQLDLNEKILKCWNSLKEASFTLKIKSGDISNVCRGKQKTAGGFKWKYK